MTSQCRAVDSRTCRVHGTGGMFRHLGAMASDALNARDFDKYHEARAKMDELTDDSKAAIKFFERGGVPSLGERVTNKMNDIADRIIETRDNINEAIIGNLSGDEETPKKNHTPSEQDDASDLRFGEKVGNLAERVSDIRDDFDETVSTGADIIADRHTREIPAEIGGSTVAWSDMNPFKKGKLR